MDSSPQPLPTEIPRLRCCQSCLHWDRQGPPDQRAGQCRHSPPVPGETAAAGWPTTGADDWCGEWLARVPTVCDSCGRVTA